MFKVVLIAFSLIFGLGVLFLCGLIVCDMYMDDSWRWGVRDSKDDVEEEYFNEDY